MSDGWTDRKQRTLINFLVNGAKGTVFMDSVDASSYMKTGEKVFELLDKFVERIGEKNVVQIITDNGSNFKSAGKMLMAKGKNLFWTPCSAHCLDLMLEDIGKIEKIKKKQLKRVFFWLVNHSIVLNMMREHTKNAELARCGVTRFATTFLTLQSLQKQKPALRNMFASEQWTSGKWANERKGQRANDIVFTPTFWNNVLLTLKIMGPLVKVLRLVDNEKKPAMGYVYEAMERAKLAIAAALGKDSNEYILVSEIIDKRWNCTLHHPLHAAGYYLNPEFYCYNETIESDKEVTVGLHDCINRLVPEKAKQDLIMAELIQWINQEGFFGLESAKRQHGKIAPAEWWKLYGKGTPNLQQLAIRVLSLTCSASGCERNWSTFEHIHSKKRNRLEHKKLHDLVPALFLRLSPRP
ncbi:putative HAT dimerization domain, ribonuclease H-like superfamily [Helianthus debilis subsp. tardiflorus]